MILHKFAAGDVSVPAGQVRRQHSAGVYTIVRRMPVTGTSCQYRVKSALDNHERVLDEAQLRPT